MGKHSVIPGGLRLAGLALVLLACSAVAADGLLDDLPDASAPQEDAGLAELQRLIETLIPAAQAIADTAQAIDEALVQAGAPVLRELILDSRDAALRAGVEPMPAEIRRRLAGFLPAPLLDAVRYRVQGGGDFTLQWNLIRYGDARAITLDHVIVFKDADDALHSPRLWVHELTHVDQYRRWGLQEFSLRYLRDFEAVEREAYEAETRFQAWRRRQDERNPVADGIISRR